MNLGAWEWLAAPVRSRSMQTFMWELFKVICSSRTHCTKASTSSTIRVEPNSGRLWATWTQHPSVVLTLRCCFLLRWRTCRHVSNRSQPFFKPTPLAAVGFISSLLFPISCLIRLAETGLTQRSGLCNHSWAGQSHWNSIRLFRFLHDPLKPPPHLYSMHTHTHTHTHSTVQM